MLTVDSALGHVLADGDLRADIDRERVLDMLGSLIHYLALSGHALGLAVA